MMTILIINNPKPIKAPTRNPTNPEPLIVCRGVALVILVGLDDVAGRCFWFEDFRIQGLQNQGFEPRLRWICDADCGFHGRLQSKDSNKQMREL